MGFPIDDNWDRDKPIKSGQKRKGIALIIAILSVALIMIFSSTMIINTQVNLELAVSHRDNVKAEYMAKSGFNLAIFLLGADWGMDLAQYSGKLGAKIPITDGRGDFWAMVNGLPIGGETLEMVSAMTEGFELNATNDEETIDVLKLFDGQFLLNVEDEGGKINVNKCAVDGRCKSVRTMLTALMSCPAELRFLESKNLKPSEMAERIRDWIDPGKSSQGSGFSGEDDPYEKKFPPYKAKNSPMDSVSELKLIEGWDDDMHTVFSPYITTFPFLKDKTEISRVNINSANKDMLSCLVPDVKSNCNEKYEIAMANNIADANNIASNKEEVKTAVSNLLCDTSGKKDDWFTTWSPVFRISSKGLVGNQQKELVAVIQRTVPDPAKKIMGSYKLLYWKLL